MSRSLPARPSARLALALGAFCLALAARADAQTFVERLDPGDLRIVSYNVLFDTIFPSVSPTQAAKFERVVAAVDADIWCLQEIDYNTPVSQVITLMNVIAPLPGGASWQGQKGSDATIISKWPLSMKAVATIPAGDKDQAMALVDLPDAAWPFDLYLMSEHYKCCGGFDAKRQKQSDAIINWMRDARNPGGFITLPTGTPMMVLGDLNIVDGLQPLQTLIDGNIIDNGAFGADSPPDWDGTMSLDAHPLHNVTGPDDWTWYSPGPYPHGRLDYVIHTDSVLTQVHAYILNTTTMTPAELAATGLQPNDVTVDSQGVDFDHLPLVIDFRGEVDPWTLLFGASSGTLGEPLLEGGGSLQGGTPVSLALSNARPNGSATLVMGLSLLAAPYKGGVLMPSPDVLVAGLPVDGAGTLLIADTWPVGIPAGVSFYSQHWIVDPAGPHGLAASNGLLGVTQ